MPLRVLILGTGALAKLIGYRLAVARAGDAPLAAVTLAGDWAAAVAAMAAGGIVLEEADGRVGRATVSAVMRDELAADLARRKGRGGGFDLVLVLVKSRQTAVVAPLAAAAVSVSGRILSLQNGLGNRERLQAAAGDPHRVMIGVTAAGATGLGPDRVRAGGGGDTQLGPAQGPGLSASAIARLFVDAGLPCTLSRDVEALLWRKLAVNCAINPLSALAGRPNGALLEEPRLGRLAAAAAREVHAVAAAMGIDLGADAAELVIEVARRTAANRSSMLQDLDRGAATEIDAICGAVADRAAALGLSAPVNAWLLAAVRRLEAGGGRAEVDWAAADALLADALLADEGERRMLR
jgi:2-dehydropantoate 2-reductase